jgi:hypothetical protein
MLNLSRRWKGFFRADSRIRFLDKARRLAMRARRLIKECSCEESAMRKFACVLSGLLISLVPQYVQAAHRTDAHRPPVTATLQTDSRELALCASLSQLHGRGVIWQGADSAARREVLAMIIALCLTSSANSDNAGMTAIRLRQELDTAAPGSF